MAAHPTAHRLIAALADFREAHSRDPRFTDLIKEMEKLDGRIGEASDVRSESPGHVAAKSASEALAQGAQSLADKFVKQTVAPGRDVADQPKDFADAANQARDAIRSAPA